jgi:molybdenum cofactor cytidylyltransferase
MASANGICGVILSAGASSRMGRDKALLPWPPATPGTSTTSGHTLLAAQIETLKPFAVAIIVVAGENFECLTPLAAAHGALLVQNPAPERGQFSSLQIALQELVERGYDAAAITLVDSPPLTSTSLQRLCTAFNDALSRSMWGVAPEYGGKRGHPLFAGRALVDAFLAAPVTSNARNVKREHAQLIESIPVDDVLLTVDVNTPEQYARLASGKVNLS